MKTSHDQTEQAIGILDKISKYSQISIEDLQGHCRQEVFVLYRQLAAYFILKNTNVTLSQAAQVLGNRDHTTMIYSRQKINDYLAMDDSKIKKPFREISQLL